MTARLPMCWGTFALFAAMLLPPPVGAAPPAELRAIRSIVGESSTRFVLETGTPVRYRLRALAAQPALHVPARLYVDLTATRPGGDLDTSWRSERGAVRRLRVVHLRGGVTRLILDVPGLSHYSAFPMHDPFRVLVDARGRPRKGAASGVAAAATAIRSAKAGRARRPSAPVVISRPTIVIDPGHGGKDPGAQGPHGLLEKDVVLDIARRVARRLEGAGYRVVLTRDRDVFVSLGERTLRASRERAVLFLSIHANASRNRRAAGIETYYLSNTGDRATIRLARMENHLAYMTGGRAPAGDVSYIVSDMIQNYKVGRSRALARDVQGALVGLVRERRAEVRDLGVKPGPFAVLVGAGMPAVLAEVSFLSNRKESARLRRPEYRSDLAKGLALGVTRFARAGLLAATL